MSRFYVIVIVIIAVIIVIAGVLISRSSDQSLSKRNAQIEEESRAIDQRGPTPSLVVTSRPSPAASSPKTTMTPFPSPSITPQAQSPRASTKMAVVIYDGLQFQPPTISITAGTRVLFENQSSEEFWPASNDHPTHQRLSGFDAGKAIAADESYEFQFDKPGDWGYHNHLQPTQTARITVQ